MQLFFNRFSSYGKLTILRFTAIYFINNVLKSTY